MTWRLVIRFAPACALALAGACSTARADAVDALREFVRDARTGRAAFTQTVISPDGVKRKVSSGSFEFARPNRFRFDYSKPFSQAIVADGQKLWLHDVDLNQVTVRSLAQALDSTPAALLAGSTLERDFELSAQAARDGLDWVLAVPRTGEGSVKSLSAGFKGRALVALEIVDAFGQRSVLRFSDLQVNLRLAEDAFRFLVPAGADVIQQ